MHLIGFLINPYAGMGGAVGLKGTDGLIDEATKRGAIPRAQERAAEALNALKGTSLHFFTCSQEMGEDAMQKAGITRFTVEYRTPEKTTADDTKNACRKFLDVGVEMIVFCGGDGTARDVFDVVGKRVPVLGIPAGVKMYSGVFAISPQSAAELLQQSGTIPLRDTEVVDVDEIAYRAGILRTTLYGYAQTPYILEMVAGTKQVFEQPDEERAKAEIAQFIAEVINGTPDKLTLLGPGTTIEKIAEVLGVDKTLLGFDAIRGRELVAADISEKEILARVSGEPEARLIISIIGAQGFVLGRGTQQISPAVIRKIGIGNIIVVATPYKLSKTPVLYVDTGVPSLDAAFGDHIKVISGYRIAQRKRIHQPVSE